jgi:hypothetical protein
MIKVTCKVKSYDEPAKTDVTVNNHWYNNGMVEIVIGDEKREVSAKELKAAIDNCTNTARY